MGVGKFVVVRRRVLATCLVVTMCSLGCYDDPNLLGPGGYILYKSPLTYNITFVNLNGPSLTNVALWWNKGEEEVVIAAAGVIGPTHNYFGAGKSGVTSYAPTRIPEWATIRWDVMPRGVDRLIVRPAGRADTNEYSQRVRLTIPPVKEPALFYGTIWIEYLDGKWVVVPQTNAHLYDRLRQHKNYVPNTGEKIYDFGDSAPLIK